MDDVQRIVKCGSLALHTPGGFFKKRWHSKYLVLYDGSKSGVKRLELFESEIKYRKQSPVKIIPLVDCVRIVTCQRHKTTFTFEVRTNDQCYLLASKSFLDMNEWVNCLRLVAFGQQPASNGQQQSAARLAQQQTANTDSAGPSSGAFPATQAASFSSSRSTGNTDTKRVDVLLSRPQPSHAAAPSSDPAGRQQQVSAQSNGGLVSATSRFGQTAQYGEQKSPPVLTASQAAAAAASALAKSRQRQPSLLGSCKPQPPNDSPFIQQNSEKASPADSAASEARTSPFSATSGGQVDTLTPTVRGQLIAAATTLANQSISSKPFNTPAGPITSGQATSAARAAPLASGKALQIGATLDEEEENMLYCSIEDNPSEHNYRVKVIETELALRCQLKCYQLTATTTISQQYEELSQLRSSAKMPPNNNNNGQPPAMVTFYQLIIGPQELTLLNDYAASYSPMRTLNRQQQGLWSWPYQCIRRYGFDKDNCFMFEAGRKCTSGPGQFIVQTPKAYNIYQDVVKFVNELRTISSMGQPAALTQSPACDSMLAPHQLSKQMIVTQIPVTWAPHNNNNNNNNNNSNSNINNNNVANNNNSASRDAAREKQFFEALRRLDRPLPASPGEGAPASHLLESTDINQNNLASKLCDSVGRPTTEPPSNLQGDQRQPVNEAAKQEATIVHQQQQSASISSSASEETDESGYEQGDESVDSGPLAEQQGQAKDRQQAAGQSGPKRSPVKTAASRLAGSDHYSTMSSSASSASPSSSASNSPGQSISRRTADLLNQKGASNDRPKPVLSQRPRLPLLHEITKVPSKTAPVKANPVQKSPQTSAARTSSSLHNLLATSCLANDAITVQGADQASAAKSALSTRSTRADEDFETNLMRDVYSEISKLHAKFAVTTAAGEDSMSSGGESVVASSSSENNTAGNEDEASREGDYDSMEGGQDCEPTYSNLRPADSERASRLGLNDSQPQRPVEHFQRGPAGHHPAHFLHDHARPPPLYPTMLNPIPEIAEHQPAGDGRQTAAERLRPAHYNNHHLEHAAEQQRRDSDHRTNKDGLPRARLALNRAAIKKQTMGPSSPAQNKRPTNHYLINDVPYAKISRDASPPPSQDKLRSAQRRA